MTLDKDDFDLLNAFAHDLKNPLVAMKSRIEMLEALGPLNDKQTDYVDIVLGKIVRMTEILDDVIAYARSESDPSLEMTEVDLAVMVHAAIEAVQDQIEHKRLQVMVDITPDLPPLVANAYMLNHVFVNLISNAVKYNRDEGALIVRIIDEVTAVRVQVQDTGLGIAPDHQNQIFDRFYRAKADTRVREIDGSGMGLSIARSVVRRHGGHIWVDSQLNEGSTFSFTLPREHSPAPLSSAEPHQLPDLSSATAHDAASELIDDLDDNLQEPHEPGETESQFDEV